MLLFVQEAGSAIISLLGTVVAIFILAVFLIWVIRKIICKPLILKWFVAVLFICIALTFMKV